MKLKTWSRPQNAFSLSLLNVNYDCVHCLDQNSSLALSLIPSYPFSFFPTLLVLPHLVNSSFFILCISSLNLQLVPKFNGASVFILPCHPSASQLLPLLPPCLPQFYHSLFPCLPLEHLLGTSSFSSVLFPSHVLGWSISSAPTFHSLSSSWLFPPPLRGCFEGLLGDSSSGHSGHILNSMESTSTPWHISPYLPTRTPQYDLQ